MTLLTAVVRHLEERGIRHALIGAAALAVHGISRSTFDLDLFTTDAAVLRSEAWVGFSAGAVDRRAGDALDPLAGVVRITASGEREVDLVVGRDDWQRPIVERASPVAIAGTTVSVVEAADLVLLKLYAGGFQDAWDIQQLLAANPQLATTVEARVAALPEGAQRLWVRIQADAR